MLKLSIIIPVYFNEANLRPLYDDLYEKVLTKLKCDYEIIMVDDGSKDNSYSVICELAKKDHKIRPVKLSRNFGSHAAILAGLSISTGNCATIKAADLQEPSEIILEMYAKWAQGIKVVLAVRSDREESFFQKFSANSYYHIVRKFCLPNMPKGGFDVCFIDRQVIDLLNLMEEKNTSLMGQILWCGFKTDTIYYVRKRREIGKSRWTLSKKIKLVMDSLLGFSYFPIRFISSVGIIFFFISIIWLIYILLAKLFIGIPIQGWTTLIVINLLSFGVIMLTLGIIGEYLWRTFDTARNRPPYIIEDIQEDDSKDNFLKKNI